MNAKRWEGLLIAIIVVVLVMLAMIFAANRKYHGTGSIVSADVRLIADHKENSTEDRHVAFAGLLRDFSDKTEEVAEVLKNLPGGRGLTSAGGDVTEHLTNLAKTIEQNPSHPFNPVLKPFRTTLLDLMDTLDTLLKYQLSVRQRRVVQEYLEMAQELVDRINYEFKVERGEKPSRGPFKPGKYTT